MFRQELTVRLDHNQIQFRMLKLTLTVLVAVGHRLEDRK